MVKKSENTYNYAIDALRVLAILAVVAIHTTTKNLDLYSHDLNGHFLLFIANQLVRFAVPLFFMISGFVLELTSPPKINYWDYLKKRANRIFLPYVFWSAIYYFFVYTYHSRSYFFTLLDGSASYQLYFIPVLLVFYLIFPVLHHFYKQISRPGFIIFLAVIQIAIQTWDYYFQPIQLFSPITNALVYFFSFYIGLIASHYHQPLYDLVKKKFLLSFLLMVLSGAYVIVQAYWRYYATHDYLAFYSQHRTSILVFTIFLGSCLYFYFNSRRPFMNFVRILSKLSFFVFFFHIMILELILKYLSPNPQPLIFFVGLSTFSFAVAYLVHRLPFLSRLTG